MRTQQGFTLVEMMVSLVLGIIISGAIVQVLVSNQVTANLNQSMASAQEAGRFIIQRLRSDVLWAGHHDRFDPALNRDVDIIAEEVFVQGRAVNIAGDFNQRPGLGSIQGADGAPDTLVVSRSGSRDCRGFPLGYNGDEFFHVVNEYFIQNERLMCRGFDGRFLRGLKAAVGHDNHNAFPLLDGVVDFQVQYGVAFPQLAPAEQASRPLQYVTADALPIVRGNQGHVVAVKIALLVRGDGNVRLDQIGEFKLLNENLGPAPDNAYYRQFETTISLRNVKNQLELQQ